MPNTDSSYTQGYKKGFEAGKLRGASASLNKTITDVAIILMDLDYFRDKYPIGELRQSVRNILEEIICSARPHMNLSGTDIIDRINSILADDEVTFFEKALGLCLLRNEVAVRVKNRSKKGKNTQIVPKETLDQADAIIEEMLKKIRSKEHSL